MRRYRRLQTFAVAALLVQFVVGLGGVLTPGREVFPFASWFLFSLVPHHESQFDVLLRTVDGQPLDPPRPFSQAAGYVRQPHSIVVYQIIQQLGQAQQAHDEAGVRALRHPVEAQFGLPGVTYDLVRVTYSPVQRWQTGRVLATQTLRSFRAGEAP